MKEEYVKMKKERDYHRMHHNRVAQEKNKLITDMKRMKAHYDTYEPMLKAIKEKYDGALREKVVNQLEKDRVVAELSSIKKIEQSSGHKSATGASGVGGDSLGPTQKRLQEIRNYEKNLKEMKNKEKSSSIIDPLADNKHPNVRISKEKNKFNQTQFQT